MVFAATPACGVVFCVAVAVCTGAGNGLGTPFPVSIFRFILFPPLEL